MSALQWSVALSSFIVCAVCLWQLRHQPADRNQAQCFLLGWARMVLFVFSAWRGADALNGTLQPEVTWSYAFFGIAVAVVLGLSGDRK